MFAFDVKLDVVWLFNTSKFIEVIEARKSIKN